MHIKVMEVTHSEKYLSVLHMSKAICLSTPNILITCSLSYTPPSSLLVFCITALLKRRWILCYYSGWLLCGIHNMRSIGICLVAISWSQTEKAAGWATGIMEMQKNQLMKNKYHKRLAKIAIALSYKRISIHI